MPWTPCLPSWKRTKAMKTKPDPVFVAAVTEAMRARDMTIGDLAYRTKLPPGFWEDVATRTGSTPDAARVKFSRNREKWSAALESSSIKNDKRIPDEKQDTVDTANPGPSGMPGPDNDYNFITRRELTAALAALESRLITMIHQTPTAITGPHDLPPRPTTRIPDRLRHVRATLDKDLFAALETYAARHHGGNISAALTAVVWRGLGRPKLSFQE